MKTKAAQIFENSVMLSIDKLIPYERNAKIHPESQIETLAKIFIELGFDQPIVLDPNYVIIKGHGRRLAAIRAGFTEVPCIIRYDLSASQVRATRIADNVIAKTDWDHENLVSDLKILEQEDADLLDIIGYQEDELKELLHNKRDDQGETNDDDVPDVPQNVRGVERGQIWQLGSHKIMCGDSTSKEDVDRLMGGERADMVFTDPPYGINVVGGDKAVGGGKIVKANKYEPVIGDLTPEVAKNACALLLSFKIPMIIWGANNFAHALPESSAWLYWQKNQTGDFADGELAWTNCKGQIKRFEHTWAGLIKASEHGQKRVHPTQKPIALAEWCFDKYMPEAKSVLDLFLGSGSTLIACEKTNRKCYGLEIDPHYCSVIIERWEKFTGQKAELIEPSPHVFSNGDLQFDSGEK